MKLRVLPRNSVKYSLAFITERDLLYISKYAPFVICDCKLEPVWYSMMYFLELLTLALTFQAEENYKTISEGNCNVNSFKKETGLGYLFPFNIFNNK